MLKHLFSLLPMLAAALALANDNPGNWVEVHTPNFTVITDSSEKQACRIGVQLERMRVILQQSHPDSESDAVPSAIVLAIRDKKEFRALEPPSYLSKRSLNLHGLFMRNSEKNYILMRLDSESGDPFAIAYHEYTHFLLSQSGRTIPLWLNEGLAQFFEKTEIHHQEVLLGEPNQSHLSLLRSERLLPLPILFSVDEKSPYYIDREKAPLFYAESWALTHYLAMKDHGGKTSRMSQYLGLIADKVDSVSAASRVFGDLNELQKALSEYIQQSKFNQLKTTISGEIDESQFDVEAITPLDAAAAEADFLVSNGRMEEARLILHHVLQEDADNVSAQETMAFLESEEQAEAEKKLRSAVQVNPYSASAYDSLAVFLWQHGKNLEEAQAVESSAVSIDANNLGYRVNLAKILLGMGQAHAASDALQPAVTSAKTPQEIEEVSRLLTEAGKYASEQNSRRNDTEKNGNQTLHAAVPPPYAEHRSRTNEPHRVIVGMLKVVHCEPPNLDLSVASRLRTVMLHAENYYKVEFTALFTPTRDLNPCEDLENRPAKVEYVESPNGSELPRVVAVELHK